MAGAVAAVRESSPRPGNPPPSLGGLPGTGPGGSPGLGPTLKTAVGGQFGPVANPPFGFGRPAGLN